MTRPYTPRPFAPLATGFMLDHPRCAIFASMGMGKTVMTYTAIDILLALREQTKPTLVLGPLRVARGTWPEQAREWEHLSALQVSAIVGTTGEREAALKVDANVFTTNYENIPWLIDKLADKWPFGCVIADESTRLKSFRGSYQTTAGGKTFLRGGGGARARALARIRHKTDRWINLTGTPTPNGLQDLWGQTWFLDAGARLGRTYGAFERRWLVTDPYTRQITARPFAMEQVQDALRDICLTLDAKDWFDLKEPILRTVWVDLPTKARNLYDEMERNLYVQIAGREAEVMNAAALTQKLLQMANGALYIDPLADTDDQPKAKEWREVHDAKIQALESIIEETAGATLLVAYQFKSDLARLRSAFPGGRHISTTEDEADLKAGRIRLAFVHPKSLGHGVDGIQNVCNTVVFFGHDWNLEEYQQIIERVGPVRQMQAGFDRVVTVYHIVARGTADEDVMARRAGKGSVQEIFKAGFKRRQALP